MRPPLTKQIPATADDVLQAVDLLGEILAETHLLLMAATALDNDSADAFGYALGQLKDRVNLADRLMAHHYEALREANAAGANGEFWQHLETTKAALKAQFGGQWIPHIGKREIAFRRHN